MPEYFIARRRRRRLRTIRAQLIIYQLRRKTIKKNMSWNRTSYLPDRVWLRRRLLELAGHFRPAFKETNNDQEKLDASKGLHRADHRQLLGQIGLRASSLLFLGSTGTVATDHCSTESIDLSEPLPCSTILCDMESPVTRNDLKSESESQKMRIKEGGCWSCRCGCDKQNNSKEILVKGN